LPARRGTSDLLSPEPFPEHNDIHLVSGALKRAGHRVQVNRISRNVKSGLLRLKTEICYSHVPATLWGNACPRTFP